MTSPLCLLPKGVPAGSPFRKGTAYPGTLGFREAPGGIQLSKTMMLAALIAVMDAMPARGAVKQAVLVDNVLGKGTVVARRPLLGTMAGIARFSQHRPDRGQHGNHRQFSGFTPPLVIDSNDRKNS